MLRKHISIFLILMLAVSLAACQFGPASTPAVELTQPPATQAVDNTQPTDAGFEVPATEEGPAIAPSSGEIILATTGFTMETGLVNTLISDFTRKTGIAVKVETRVNPNQVLELGSSGLADVLLSHAPPAEASFEEKGFASERRLVMHNDFVIVGPPNDPAGLQGSTKIDEVFQKIFNARSLFATRADNSVINRLEKFLWQKAKLKPAGDWYFETYRIMKETLGIASERGAYTIADRVTYLRNKNDLNLAILYQNDLFLMNYYHVIVINPEKFPNRNVAGARQFAEYLVSPEAQQIIANYLMSDFGEAIFFADGDKTDAELGLPEASLD
jgi:tungstate transport system substrate-binding protein